MQTIGQSLPELFAAYASLKRIQAFLALPEKASSEGSALDEDNEISDKDKLALEDLASENDVKVEIKSGTFGWDDKTAVLHDIDLDLQPGKLHMIVGSVASGKTTLLMTLLGETIQQKGSLDVKARKVRVLPIWRPLAPCD